MDFWIAPPEVTSARLYAGPGAGSLLTAAATWDTLATELHTTATDYRAVIAAISEEWTGPSATAMTAAAAPYVAWLSSTAAQAAQTAAQSRAAAAAYESALAATVPPSVIAANRSHLALLVATNLLGQNLPAIAATQAQYGQMWAQDIAAMAGYATAAAAATRLTEPTPPPPTTTGTAPAVQAAAQAGGTQSVLSQIPQLLKGLADATASYNTEMGNLLGGLTGNPAAGSIYTSGFSTMASLAKFSTLANDSMSAPNLGMVQFKTFFQPPAAAPVPTSALGAGLALQPPVTTTTPAVSAGVGEAARMGRLSVPPGWATATPPVRVAAPALPITTTALAPTVPAVLPAALGAATGAAIGTATPRALGATRIISRTTNGKPRKTPVKLDDLITTMRDKPETVRHWEVDHAGLDDLLAELAHKPGNHAVHVATRKR